MPVHQQISQIKLFAICLAAVLGSLSFASSDTSVSRASALASPQIDISGTGASLAERVGGDDGALFAVMFTGDMHGNLDTCG